MKNYKPTHKEPVNAHSKKFEKDFAKTMATNNLSLSESDDMLTEKEQSLKKKIFSLAKMEALVFSDPKLTTIYDDMAINGEEKYGYHYNETIMNMLFNDYVLNSAKYLQKYKNAVPKKKKKRRDKSGIDQMKKHYSGEDKKKKDVDESTTAGGGGSGAYETPFAWSNNKDNIMRKPIWAGGTIIGESNYIIDPTDFKKIYESYNEECDDINEEAKSKNQQKFMGMVHAYKKGELNDDEVSDKIKKAAENMTDKEVKKFASTKHNDLPDKVNEVSMLDPNDTSMAVKPEPTGGQSNNMPNGMQQAQGVGGMSEEEDINFDEILEEINMFKEHHNVLVCMSEEKRPSALVLKDRMGSENEKNFKSDMKNNSSTKDVLKMEKDMQWKNQQEDVGDDPYKRGEDIEKDVIKKTKGEVLKNVGNSTNKKGDEIPKRNITDEEQDEINKYRMGMEDLEYDIEPDDKFTERMKRDMGEEKYEQGVARKEIKKNSPMYNKDAQPIESDTEHLKRINETLITGRYVDILNKKRIIDFAPKETIELKEGDNTDTLYPINFTGFGNKYNGVIDGIKLTINEGIDNYITTNKFYSDGSKVYRQKSNKMLNENVSINENKNIINIDKMRKLYNYNPKTYIDTKEVKRNRKF